jgi:hypothetical protein
VPCVPLQTLAPGPTFCCTLARWHEHRDPIVVCLARWGRWWRRRGLLLCPNTCHVMSGAKQTPWRSALKSINSCKVDRKPNPMDAARSTIVPPSPYLLHARRPLFAVRFNPALLVASISPLDKGARARSLPNTRLYVDCCPCDALFTAWERRSRNAATPARLRAPPKTCGSSWAA